MATVSNVVPYNGAIRNNSTACHDDLPNFLITGLKKRRRINVDRTQDFVKLSLVLFQEGCPSRLLASRTAVHANISNLRKLENKEEQIIETRDKPQCLVVQRLLSHLQYPDATKSSTKDLSLPPFNLKSSWHQSLSISNQPMKSEQVYFFSRNSVSGRQHCLVSQDSDLEAFSRNPTHGSFAAMAFQPSAFTNYANQVFLSY